MTDTLSVVRVFLRLAVVVALLGLTPMPANAEPPPPLDVQAAMAALGHEQIYTAPGSAARIDLNVVRKAMAPTTRLLIAPYQPKDQSFDEHTDAVYTPLLNWAKKNHLDLIMVEGIQATLVGSVRAGPTSLSDLREHTAYHEVTGAVLELIDYLKDPNASGRYPPYQVVAPSPAQLDDLAAKLRANPIYNAPGRDDPVRLTVDELATSRKVLGHELLIAALPLLDPGEPFVDYAPALAKRFPGSVVMVAQGDWLEVKGPNQAVLDSARDFVVGRFEYSLFTDGVVMDNHIGEVVGRVHVLLQKKPFGRPQPASQPKPVPYDVRRAISNAAPWALLGAAIVLTGSGLTYRRSRTAREAAEEKKAMRREKARAFAKIGDLDAKLLAVEEAGGTADAAAAERQATARTLYEQALTSVAMREVAKVADEGLLMLVKGADR